MKKIIAFQKIGLTVAALIFSIGFLIQSTSPAVADAPETTYEAGRYQMELSATYDGYSKKVYFYILAYDTFTGRSKLYSGAAGKATTAAPNGYNLPSSPL